MLLLEAFCVGPPSYMKRSYGCICAAAVHRSIWQNKIRSLKYNVVYTFILSYRENAQILPVHEGKKSFQCEICSTSFSRSKLEQMYWSWIKEIDHSNLNVLPTDFMQKAP